MNCIIASTSTVHGSLYLSYILPELEKLYSQTDEILFIPYARASGLSHDEYTKKAQQAFSKIGKTLQGIHTFSDPVQAIQTAKGIFVGGGNTFLLVKELHENKLVATLAKAIQNGARYLGTSAGSNICGQTMQTTNDMPIVYPPSFKTLGVLPFNINPHYLDPDPKSTHKGETRATRIHEFHQFNDIPVIGLREGSWIEINANEMRLKGDLQAVLFRKNQNPIEIKPENLLNNLT
ncbi:MAG: dipeptidase PepE [Bacteroidota bacterium]